MRARNVVVPSQDPRKLLNTPVKRMLAAYLAANPYTYEHLPGLVYRLDTPLAQLDKAVRDLVAAGVLLKMGHGPHALYALNVQEGWAETLSAHFARNPQPLLQITRLYA